MLKNAPFLLYEILIAAEFRSQYIREKHKANNIMKKLHLFLFVALLSCLAMGCRKPVEVSFDVESMHIAAEGGTYTAELKSNGEWSLATPEEWLTVTPTSGNGDATLTFEAQPNPGYQPRSLEVKATTKDNTALLTIEQEGIAETITLTPNSMLGDWEGGSFQVVVQTTIAWTVTTLPDWVTCSVMEGVGDDTLWMTMHPFLEPGNREAYITFGNGNTSAQFHVRQSGTSSSEHFLHVVPNEIHAPYSGEVKTLVLTCDEAWAGFSDMDWTVLSKTEGEGNDVIELTIAANPFYVARQTSVKFITPSQNAVAVEIFQEAAPDPHFLEVTPTALSFAHEGESQEIAVACDVDWTIEVSEDWLSLSTTEGTGSGSVTVTAAPNVYNESRQAAINVVSGNLSRRVIVTQEPGEELFVADVDPDTLFVAQAGGAKSFVITSNTNWVLTVPSWITVLTTSGSGEATVEMMVGTNVDFSSRIGYITIMHNGMELARVVVVQEGIPAVLSTDVEEIVFTREGGAQYFNIQSNVSWEIENVADWLVCYPSEGTGNMEVLVKATQMYEVPSREVVLAIRGSYGTLTFLVVRQVQ